MKILGISGGTKNGANDCMCKEALLAAKEQGAEIEFVRLMDLEIKHCTGCKACVMSLFSGRGNMTSSGYWIKCWMQTESSFLFRSLKNVQQVFSILLWTVLDRVWAYPTTLLRTRSQQQTAADGSIQNI